MSSETAPLPIPRTDDPDAIEFWAGAAQRRLMVAIGADGRPVHPPRRSGVNTPVRWVQAAGTGLLHTWTLVSHTVDPAFPAPYTIVLVALTDYPQVRFIGHLPGAPVLLPGAPMQVHFEDRDGIRIPQWRPCCAT